MLHPPPSAILETVAGSFPSLTPLTISTVSAMSGKFMVASLVWMTVLLTVTSKELRRPTLPKVEYKKKKLSQFCWQPTFHISRRNRRENCRAQFLHAGLVASGATVLDINLHHRSVVSSCLKLHFIRNFDISLYKAQNTANNCWIRSSSFSSEIFQCSHSHYRYQCSHTSRASSCVFSSF